MTQQVSVRDITSAIDSEFEVLNERQFEIVKPAPIDNASPDSITFCNLALGGRCF